MTMIDSLIDIDTSIFLWLNSQHHPFWDVFMMMASGKLIWVLMYASLLFALWQTYGWRTFVAVVGATLLAVTFADQVTASVLRPVFERLRPANLENPISDFVHVVNDYRGGRYGFPSCHAANSFALATLMSLVFQRWRFTLFMVMWATLNCYSRIYLGVHYPGDILCGMLIGCFSGTVFYLAALFTIRHWKGAEGTGKADLKRKLVVNGHTYYYRPLDFTVRTGVVTVLFIFICSTTIWV